MAVRASKLRSTKLCYVLPSQSLYSLFTQVVSSIVRCDWLTRRWAGCLQQQLASLMAMKLESIKKKRPFQRAANGKWCHSSTGCFEWEWCKNFANWIKERSDCSRIYVNLHVLYKNCSDEKFCNFRQAKMEVLIILDVWLPISLVGSLLIYLSLVQYNGRFSSPEPKRLPPIEPTRAKFQL